MSRFCGRYTLACVFRLGREATFLSIALTTYLAQTVWSASGIVDTQYVGRVASILVLEPSAVYKATTASWHCSGKE